MTRAHSFRGKFCQIPENQFAEFHSLPWQNRPNSAAHHGLAFVSKLSSILFKKL